MSNTANTAARPSGPLTRLAAGRLAQHQSLVSLLLV